MLDSDQLGCAPLVEHGRAARRQRWMAGLLRMRCSQVIP
jgi:hypothetical protein